MLSYHEHSCDGLGSAVADYVPLKVELFDGGVFLSEVERKDTVSGGLVTGVKMHGKGVSIVGAQFKSPWVQRSADTDRKSLGKVGPAFVGDLLVL